MISEKSSTMFHDVSNETFIEDLCGYLKQRLADEADQVASAKKILADENSAAPQTVHVKSRPVVVRFTFVVNEARMEVLAVGKDFALCLDTRTNREEKINFTQVVRYRDVSDEDNAGRS